ncbi:hypothetical protein A5320_04595 [Rheinheimera sp. SA_1]|uniref:DUF1801 domain-containing protein n=1 Tax=Rheinheimera sp. SA_1 TaxID=1827365 RepID=UPI0008015729|nr:DUF1801 domain-containing protein [Rheinheimera sp. SA_1]OBP16673.1 hypothetical protein A5320_04595 [Rheinheimera sp. SA_1]
MQPELQTRFNSYPPQAQQQLEAIRQLILTVAAEQALGYVEESIKWGEASFLVKGGTAIRIDWKAKDPEFVKLFFHCQTRLVETFREIYPAELRYEGNRAVLVPLTANIQHLPLAHCILLAMRYHQLKHLPLLGASPGDH